MLTKLKSLSLYLLVIVAFVGGMVALLLFLRPNPEQVKLAVTDFFQESTGCLIEMDNVRPDGMLLPAIRMSGLRLYAKDGEEVAKLRWLQADLSVSELITGGIGISHIHLVEPEIKFTSFEKCLNKVHLPSKQVAGQAAQVSVILDRAKLLWPDNPLPEMQELSFPSLEGQWDGSKNLKLYGHIQSLTGAEAQPVHLSMRTGAEAVDRFSFDFLAPTDGPLVNTRKISTYLIRPQKKTGHFSLNIANAGWVPFLSNTPFADEALKLEAELNLAEDGVRFENIEGQIGEESFQGHMNMHIQAGAASYLDAGFSFGILDKNIALSLAGLNQSVAGFSKLASKLAKAPFEIDLGITASGLAADDGEMARAPNIHLIAGLGSVTVDQFNLGLPGGTEVSLLADFMPDPSGEDAWFTSGGLSLQSSNLRRSLTWLGYDVTEFAPDLLRQFSLTTNFEMDAARLSLNDLDIRLDQSNAVGQLDYEDGTSPTLNTSLDFKTLQLDGYVGQDWSFAEFPDVIEFVKSTLWAAEVDLSVEELFFNQIKHEDVQISLNKDQNGFDLVLENYAPTAHSNLDMNAAVDWSTETPKVNYEAAYRSIALDDLFDVQKEDLDLLIGNQVVQELILSLNGQGDLSRLQNEFSGDLGDVSFVGKGDLSLMTNGLEFQLNQMDVNRGDIELSDVNGRVLYSLNNDTSLEDIHGKVGLGQFQLNYNQAGKQQFNVHLQDICQPSMEYALQGWIVARSCIAEGMLGGSLVGRMSLDGSLSGPLEIDIEVDEAKMPAGMVENLAGNILTYLPEETTSFTTGVSYQNSMLEFDQLQIRAKQTEGQGRATYNRLTDRLNLDVIFQQNELTENAIDLQVSGPLDGLNMRLKGNWLKEIR